MWQLQLELTQTSAQFARHCSRVPPAPPGGSKRFLLTLADLDTNDTNRITAIVGASPMTERSVDVTIKELRILPPFAIGSVGQRRPDRQLPHRGR